MDEHERLTCSTKKVTGQLRFPRHGTWALRSGSPHLSQLGLGDAAQLRDRLQELLGPLAAPEQHHAGVEACARAQPLSNLHLNLPALEPASASPGVLPRALRQGTAHAHDTSKD